MFNYDWNKEDFFILSICYLNYYFDPNIYILVESSNQRGFYWIKKTVKVKITFSLCF